MQIAMNTVVTMTYELKDADGVVLESVSYTHLTLPTIYSV